MDATTYRSLGFLEKNKTRDITNSDFNFTFTDRDSYLEFVRKWKENYKSLSENIRSVKQQRRGENMSDMQSEAHYLGLQARGMLIERRFAKRKSADLRERQFYVEHDEIAEGSALAV